MHTTEVYVLNRYPSFGAMKALYKNSFISLTIL